MHMFIFAFFIIFSLVYFYMYAKSHDIADLIFAATFLILLYSSGNNAKIDTIKWQLDNIQESSCQISQESNL